MGTSERAVKANLRGYSLEVGSVSCPAAALPARCEATLPDGTVLTMTDAQGARWVYEARFSGDGARHRATIYAMTGSPEIPG